MLRIEKRGSAGADTAPEPGVEQEFRDGATAQPPRLPGRRNPKWIALGVIAICLGALLSYVIYAKVAAESSVLIMTKTVYRGSVIMAEDLAPVTISGTAAGNAVLADRAGELVGRAAIYDLVAGSIVPAGAIGEVIIPAEGRAVAGLRLVEGRAPVGLLHPGSVIRLIALPPEGAEPDFADQYTGDAFPATVVDAVAGADGMSTLVNVDVAADQAAAVAFLAAQDRLAAVRDFDGER
ncbi:SAF domain-containing protein [Microlunatus speluncae]|uniref:SAF domain-containing protein n=1 Tax=Microlunatus speluncae TaxID=2594267 RepID=UPI001266736F|nr:SAF domain-containing protein [Microlunatus speluncae]